MPLAWAQPSDRVQAVFLALGLVVLWGPAQVGTNVSWGMVHNHQASYHHDVLPFVLLLLHLVRVTTNVLSLQEMMSSWLRQTSPQPTAPAQSQHGPSASKPYQKPNKLLRPVVNLCCPKSCPCAS